MKRMEDVTTLMRLPTPPGTLLSPRLYHGSSPYTSTAMFERAPGTLAMEEDLRLLVRMGRLWYGMVVAQGGLGMG